MDKSLSAGKIAKLSFLALAFTPLIVFYSTLFPFITGKIAFIRGMMALFAVALAIYLWQKQKKGEGFFFNLAKLRSPVFWLVLVFTLLALVSTIFADSSYLAFFGNVERAEGFLILFYMLIFFGGTLVLFHREDWLNFFKLSLLVGLLVSMDALAAFLAGIARPGGSFIGNPAFVAAYSLFAIFSAWLVLINEKRKVWMWLSRVGILLSVAAILVSGTRGAFLGVFLGAVTVMLLAVVRGNHWDIGILGRRFQARKAGWVALLLIVGLATTFVVTKDSALWQRVPVLDRLAKVSVDDQTTQTRLRSIGISMRAVDPSEVGPWRTLLGWGPDNFETAYNNFYDPTLQKYELQWFDRAHNKLLDVLVMNGILGLLAYLTLWAYVLKLVFFKRRGGVSGDSGQEAGRSTAAAIGFFAVAYFTQNLFVFDQITTYIPFYAFLGFTAYHYRSAVTGRTISKLGGSLLAYSSAALGLLLTVAFVWLSVIPIYQMTSLVGAAGGNGFTQEVLSRATRPNNYAQAEIRFQMISLAAFSAGRVEAIEPALVAISLEDEVIDRGSSRARAHQNIASLYTNMGKIHGVEEFLTLGEEHLNIAGQLAPGRQEVMFFKADNLVAQGRFEEAKVVINDLYNLEPEGKGVRIYSLALLVPYDWDGSAKAVDELYAFLTGYIENGEGNVYSPAQVASLMRGGYRSYLAYFSRVRDADGFVRSMEQAIKIEKILERVSDEQLEAGLLEAPLEANADSLRAGLEIFKKNGWGDS